MGPKLMNCCKLEQAGTKEYGKMIKRIQVLEDGKVPAKEARNWKIEGQKEESRQRLVSKFKMEGFMAQKGLWKFARENVLQDRGQWSKEEGDVIREF